MEPTFPTQPQSVPQPQPTIPPVAPQSIPKVGILQRIFPFLLAVVAIFFGAFIYYVIQKVTTTPEQPIVTTIIATPTVAPTPFRNATVISTSSAFISLETDISSFSSELSEFSKDDPSLSPPNLVLPLGLDSK